MLIFLIVILAVWFLGAAVWPLLADVENKKYHPILEMIIMGPLRILAFLYSRKK